MVYKFEYTKMQILTRGNVMFYYTPPIDIAD